MIQITATDFKTNLGKYLAIAHRQDIHITKNGSNIAVLTAPKVTKSWVDELIGVIPNADTDTKKTKAERLAEKYENLD